MIVASVIATLLTVGGIVLIGLSLRDTIQEVRDMLNCKS